MCSIKYGAIENIFNFESYTIEPITQTYQKMCFILVFSFFLLGKKEQLLEQKKVSSVSSVYFERLLWKMNVTDA